MKKTTVQRENIKLSIKIGKLSNCLTRIRILSIYAFQKMAEPGCSWVKFSRPVLTRPLRHDPIRLDQQIFTKNLNLISTDTSTHTKQK